MPDRNTEFEFSAGGVVKEKNRFLLIKTADKSIWTFPKGKLKKGESPSQAALREVLEETGYRCRIEKEITDVKYLFNRRGKLVIKKVKWFLMSPVKELKKSSSTSITKQKPSNAITKQNPSNAEIKKVQWSDYKESCNLLKYKSDLNLLNQVKND